MSMWSDGKAAAGGAATITAPASPAPLRASATKQARNRRMPGRVLGRVRRIGSEGSGPAGSAGALAVGRGHLRLDPRVQVDDAHRPGGAHDLELVLLLAPVVDDAAV